MSMNTLAFAQRVTGELDKAVVSKPVTGFLADNALRSKFVGTKTVLIPELELSGLADYDRDTGFIKGTITVGSQPFTLEMDRGRSFQLDAQDEDETGVAGLAGQMLGEFVRTRVVPELDAYCLSKLAGYAATKNQTVTGTPATQAFAMFMEAVGKAQNAIGYDEELVAFVDSTMWAAFQKSSEIAHYIEAGSFRKGEASLEVKKINGIAILPVPDSRMKSAYTFNDGSTDGQTEGGFAPTAEAKSIGLLLMPKRGASLIKKTEQVRIFDPAQNLNADAWKFDYRLYYDIILRNSMAGGIITYTY